MRKTLIAVAVIAAGALAYYKFGPGMAGAPALPGLDYVPADTALLSAQVTPIDLGSYLSSLGMGPQNYDANMQQAFADMAAETSEPQFKFGLALGQTYMKALSEPAAFSSNTGIKAQIRSLTYMVGLSPVVRVELADEAAFWRLFDDAEKSTGFSHVAQQINSVKYRQYRFTHEELSLDLLVSVQDGWATIALTSEKFDKQHLAILVQAEKPEQNLANTSVIKDLQQKYQLDAGAFGYLSTAQFTKFLTSKDGNRLAKDVEAAFGAQTNVMLADWRNAACDADVAAISASWPGLFIDNKFDLSNPAKVKAIGRILIPTENQETVKLMAALRGFLPAHTVSVENSGMFSTAIGLDVAQLAPTLGKLWTGLTEPAYSCQPLAEMQTQMKQSNPLAAVAMAGMASGLQGISVTINDAEMDLTTSNLKSADALVTISAENARTFFEGLKAFYPPLANVALPAAGEELDVAAIAPEVAMLGIQPKLALSDSHLLLYVGPTATTQSAAVAKESLSKNGLLSFGMDYGRFFKTLESSMKASGTEVPPDFQQFAGSNMKMTIKMDVNQQGLILNTDMEMAQATK
jgi:hypothetical protein